jgi:hypothetical protein
MNIRSDTMTGLFAAVIFLIAAHATNHHNLSYRESSDHVVIPASLQLVIYGGDRYLAANIEMIRAAALGVGVYETDTTYLVRMYEAVSRLNPCHEDSYYLGNALLSWGGAQHEGTALLSNAMKCRFWDDLPPFFYAINQYFFGKDVDETVRALEIAAQRSSTNSSAFKKMAIMITAEELDNDQLALNYLRQQRSATRDKKLDKMLEKRIIRMEGLISLKQAQARYEKRFNRKLTDPEQLIRSGILDSMPKDPLKLGYVFESGEFSLRNLRIVGRERN